MFQHFLILDWRTQIKNFCSIPILVSHIHTFSSNFYLHNLKVLWNILFSRQNKSRLFSVFNFTSSPVHGAPTKYCFRLRVRMMSRSGDNTYSTFRGSDNFTFLLYWVCQTKRKHEAHELQWWVIMGIWLRHQLNTWTKSVPTIIATIIVIFSFMWWLMTAIHPCGWIFILAWR